MRIAILQLNFTVGDLKGNGDKIISAVKALPFVRCRAMRYFRIGASGVSAERFVVE